MRLAGRLLIFSGFVGAAAWWAFGAQLVEAWLGPDLATAPAAIHAHARLDPEHREVPYFLRLAVPAGFRLFLGLVVVGLLLTRERIRQAASRLVMQARHPEDLALARVVVFGALALYVSPEAIQRFAALPVELFVPPPGWAWAGALLPPAPAVLGALAWLLIGSAVCAAIGLWPRLSAWTAVLLAIPVLAVPQLYGKINHYHHLVWFASILAASPSWDVWAIRVRTPSREPDARYGRPLAWMALLIGTIYFFAGWWKWIVAGPSWINGSALATMLHAQWYRVAMEPVMRPDVGLWAGFAGTLVLVFELGFIWSLFTRRAKWLFVAGAFVFHVSVLVVAGINFWSLAVCLVVFLPVGDWVRAASGARKGPASPLGVGTRGRPRQAAGRTAKAPPAAAADTAYRASPEAASGTKGPNHLVAPTLFAAAVFCGITGLDTWPVGIYPTFAGLPDHRYATVILRAGDVELDPYRSENLARAFGQSRIMGLAWQITGSASRPPDPDKAAAVVWAFGTYEPRLPVADTVDVFEVIRDVRPGHAAEISRRLVARVPAGGQ